MKPTTTAPEFKVVTLIQKLITLSKDGGATESEAALALEKAQAMMAAHNLTMAHIEAKQGATKETRVKDAMSKGTLYTWQRALMKTVCRVNFCYMSVIQERGKIPSGYEIIGRESNVTSAKDMFEYLLASIERLVRADVEDPTQYFTKYAASYRKGCSERLRDRLEDKFDREVEEQERKAKEEAQAAPQGSQALVTLRNWMGSEKDLNDDFRTGKPAGYHARNRAEWVEKNRTAEKAREEKKAGFIAAGFSDSMAYYMSWGYSEADARKICEPPKETPKQAKARQQREYNDWQRYQAKQAREAAKIDQTGYSRGRKAAENVSFSDQIRSSNSKAIA